MEKKQELEELAAMKAAAAATKTNTPVTPSKTSTSTIDKEAKKRERQIRRAVEEIEAKMATLDEEIANYEEVLCDPEVFSNHEKALTIQSKLDIAKETHETLEMEWLELNEELESL